MIKVLAVDDEAPIRQWLRYCISRFPDFSCIIAANAQEGISLALTENPDILLSDIEMPGMSGLDMMKKIREQIPDIYSIVLTSHEDFEYARTALIQGAAEYMLKAEMTEESLHEVLLKAKSSLDKRRGALGAVSCERFLQALALRREAGTVPMEELERQGVPLREGSVIALDIQCEQVDKLQKRLQDELTMLEHDLRQQLTMLENCTFFSLGTDHLLLAANVKRGVQNVEAQVYEICRRILAPFPGSCCGIGMIQPDPTRLWAAIENARYRCSLSFYQPHIPIFWQETATDLFKEENTFQLEYIRALLEQNFSEAYRHVKLLTGKAREAMPADIPALKTLYSSAVSSFFHFTKEDQELPVYFKE